MNIFLFENYRNLLKKTITSLPKEGHGQAKKLAQYLGVSTTLISQILAEQKHMTLDQAFLSTEFFTFNELESRYFIALVQYEKAGSKSFKMSLQKDLNKYREQSQKLEKRLTHQQILTEEQKAYFYSDWTYSAIRMLSSIKDFDSPDAIDRKSVV